MMCVPGTLRTAAPPNCQSRPPSPRLIIVESTTVCTSRVKVEPSVTLPAALIATSCPTITLAMSADLLMSPIDTCKFGGMGLSTSVIQPTRAKLDVPGADFWYVEDGKIKQYFASAVGAHCLPSAGSVSVSGSKSERSLSQV